MIAAKVDHLGLGSARRAHSVRKGRKDAGLDANRDDSAALTGALRLQAEPSPACGGHRKPGFWAVASVAAVGGQVQDHGEPLTELTRSFSQVRRPFC